MDHECERWSDGSFIKIWSEVHLIMLKFWRFWEQISRANFVARKLGSYVKVCYLYEQGVYLSQSKKCKLNTQIHSISSLQRTMHNSNCLAHVSLNPPIPLKFITFNKTATRIDWTSLIFSSNELRTLKAKSFWFVIKTSITFDSHKLQLLSPKWLLKC